MTEPKRQGRNIDALLFDLNGTLVEIYKVSEYMANIEHITSILGVQRERFETAWKRSWREYPFGDYPSVVHRFKSALAHYHGTTNFELPGTLDRAIEARLGYIDQQQQRIKPGVIEALEWATTQGYRLGLVSNCSTETAIVWPSNPLARFFPDPTLSCVVKMKKPDLGIFHESLRKLDVPAERCIYVADGDDHEFDAAKALGMETVLVTYDLADVYRHEPFPESRHAITDFKEFPGVVLSIEHEHDARKIQER